MQLQMQKAHRDPDKLQLWDWILIIGITLAPMNELRVWKVGPSELILAIWSLRSFYSILDLSLQNYLVKFWLVFLIVISAGTLYGVHFYPNETNASGLLTYVFFALISIGIYTGLRTQTKGKIRKIMQTIGVAASCWYMFLYIYSLTISKEFIGTHLWYANLRFTAGADNPHQIGVTIACVGFLNVVQIFDKNTRVQQKILPIVCSVFSFIIARATQSSTLVVAYVITFLLFVYYLSFRSLKSSRDKWIAFSLVVIALALGIGLFRDYLYDMIYEWIADDPNGLGRINIFASIDISIRKNWLFGLGPGIHAMNGYIEYHNSYLEILAMGGVIGLTIFISFTVQLFKDLIKEPSLIFVIAPVYFYGLAGFSMRRSIFWVMVAILIAYSEKIIPEPTANDPIRGGMKADTR